LWRGRVRSLEEMVLSKFFDGEIEVDERWIKALSGDLREHHYKITLQEVRHLQAFGRMSQIQGSAVKDSVWG